MNIRLLTACLLVAGCTVQTDVRIQTQETQARPKLVVGITVDQMRADYLTRFGAWDDVDSPATFGEGGFRRMVEDGFACRDHHFGYAPTYTGPGHASIYTGTTPAVHGIVGNNWYDRAAKESVYCASDTSVRGVSNDGLDGDGSALGGSGKMSPARLLSTTLGDELKVATGGAAKVFGMSMKDRGAILPAGHAADGAFWFYGKDRGQFISSNHYGEVLPDWMQDFNDEGRAQALMDEGWNKLHPDEVYAQCLPDNNPYEGAFKGELKPTFPYDLNALAEENGGFDVLKGTPGGNTLIVDVALAAVKGAELGQDDVTDLLALSFSATDYVGHRVGPHAQETMDMYLRLDAELARLFDALDDLVGPGAWTAFLSADHGGANVPSHAGVPGHARRLLEARQPDGRGGRASARPLWIHPPRPTLDPAPEQRPSLPEPRLVAPARHGQKHHGAVCGRALRAPPGPEQGHRGVRRPGVGRHRPRGRAPDPRTPPGPFRRRVPRAPARLDRLRPHGHHARIGLCARHPCARVVLGVRGASRRDVQHDVHP